MVAPAPTHPLILLNLKIDQGEKHFAGRTVTFQTIPFAARVISYGTVDRSIPYPSGQMQVNDARVEVEDIDGQVKAWFDEVTPLRRLGEIVFEWEENKDLDGDVDLPLPGDTTPVPEPTWKPLFTGEIVPGGVKFPPGKAVIDLRDITTLWLNRPLPKLLIRDNFPHMPDDLESAFSPIIFGRVESFTEVNVKKQGVILCPHVSTTLNQYNVARHPVYSVIAVYRKKRLEKRFTLVSPAEYTVVPETKTINGLDYTFTHIEFIVAQKEGTVIHADVSGFPYRYDLDSGLIPIAGEQQNPVDAIITFLLDTLRDEVNFQKLNIQSFKDTRSIFQELELLCDGAITEQLNSGTTSTITPADVLSKLCGNFGIDWFSDNNGTLTLHYYQTSEVYRIPVNTALTVKNSMTPSIPATIYNRLRYRYYRQNAGLTEFVASAESGQWRFEETLDNVVDQDELSNTGQNPLLELVVELDFIRDEDTAYEVIKRRMGYYTLRSYALEVDMPVPPIIPYVTLSTPISISHFNGIGDGGWANKVLKVYGIAFNLKSFIASVKAVCLVDLTDGEVNHLPISHPSHDVQAYEPQLTSIINENEGDVSQQVDFNDFEPSPPLIEDVSVKIDWWTDFYLAHGYSPTDAGTAAEEQVESSEYEFINVRWQEDDTTEPRKVSAYVPIPTIGTGGARVRYFTGTLNPDQRPVDLTDSDIRKVIFYSTDFNHEYFWVGTGEDGTASGWLIKDEEPDEIRWRRTAPTTVGWHLCDGSTNIPVSDYKGDLSTITVPDLLGGTFPYGNSSYTGPTPASAVAPTTSSVSMSGSHTHTGSAASHTHSVSGGTTGSGGVHTPTVDTIVDLGHHHEFSIDAGDLASVMTADSDGSHNHGGTTGSDGPGTTENDGAHSHSGATIAKADLEHTHDVDDATGNSSGHTHGLSDLTAFIDGESSTGDLDAETPIGASQSGDSVDVSGTETDDESGHTHPIELVTEGPNWTGGGSTISVTIGSSGDHAHDISDHTHSISSGGSHTHTISASAVGLYDTGPKVADGDPELTINMNEVSGHTHSFSGSTTGSTSPSLTIDAGGSHTHTVSMNTDGLPKRMGLLPYLRL